MAILFEYTDAGDFGSIGDNKVRVTGGISDTPATFADFVTADRAGTITLLDSGVIDADPDTFTIEKSIKAYVSKVIPVTISASADRVGATIDISGLDYDNNVISESGIDISSAHTTPVESIVKFNEIGVNTELITNGAFDSDTSGWTASAATLTQGVKGGRANSMEVADSGSWSCAYQDFTTIIGQSYTILAYLYPKDSTNNNAIIIIDLGATATTGWGDYDSRSQIGSVDTWKTHSLIFTATGTTTRIMIHSESTYSAYVDDIICLKDGIVVNGMTNGDTITIAQGQWDVISDYGDKYYKLDCHFEVGDDSTSTYFEDSNVAVYNAEETRIRVNANFVLNDSYFSEEFNWNDPYFGDGGVIKFYRCTIYNPGPTNSYQHMCINTGEFYCYDTTLKTIGGNTQFIIYSGVSDGELDNVGFYGGHSPSIRSTNIISSGIVSENQRYGWFAWYATSYVTDLKVINASYNDIQAGEQGNVELINPRFHPSNVDIVTDGYYIKETYKCNIEIANKDGTLIDGVTVLCEDKNNTQVFSELTGATDTGKIDEQIIEYRRWVDTSETLTTYSPHKLTFSKAGYETLVLENITVDGPIDWHLELQGAIGPGVQKQWR